jgi:branched-chain amino acid transport system permease protein
VVRFDDGFVPGVKAFTAAVRRHRLAARCRARGLLIGIIETLWAEYVSSAYKDVAFSILAIVMIFLRRASSAAPTSRRCENAG